MSMTLCQQLCGRAVGGMGTEKQIPEAGQPPANKEELHTRW